MIDFETSDTVEHRCEALTISYIPPYRMHHQRHG
jgi:hypothetical protein